MEYLEETPGVEGGGGRGFSKLRTPEQRQE